MTNLNTRATPALEDHFWAKVDKSGECWLWTGAKQARGYGRIRDGRPGKVANPLAHRLSYELHYGTSVDGLDVDHICHNRSCVNPEHLRAVTHKVNLENRATANRNNQSSGIRGVHKARGVWKVSIRHDGDLLYFGCYQTKQEAEEVAIRERARLFTTIKPGGGTE